VSGFGDGIVCYFSILARRAEAGHSLNADICACFTQPQDTPFMKAA
jgi:hypothetical protein